MLLLLVFLALAPAWLVYAIVTPSAGLLVGFVAAALAWLLVVAVLAAVVNE